MKYQQRLPKAIGVPTAPTVRPIQSTPQQIEEVKPSTTELAQSYSELSTTAQQTQVKINNYIHTLPPDTSPQEIKAYEISLKNAEALANTIRNNVSSGSFIGLFTNMPRLLAEEFNALYLGNPSFAFTMNEYGDAIKSGNKQRIQTAHDKLISEYLAMHQPYWSDVFNDRKLAQIQRTWESPVTQIGISIPLGGALSVASRAPGLTGFLARATTTGFKAAFVGQTGYTVGETAYKSTMKFPEPYKPLTNYALTSGLQLGGVLLGTKLYKPKIGKFETVPGREISLTERKFLGDTSIGITKKVPSPFGGEPGTVTKYGRISQFIGKGKKIRATMAEYERYQPKTEVSTSLQQREGATRLLFDIEKVSKPKKSFGKYKIQTSYASLELERPKFYETPSLKGKPSQPALPEYGKPRTYKTGDFVKPTETIKINVEDLTRVPEIKGKAAFEAIKKQLAAGTRTESQYKKQMETIVKGVGVKPSMKEPGTRTTFSFTEPAQVLEPEIAFKKPQVSTLGKKLYQRQSLIQQTEVIKIPELTQSFVYVPLTQQIRQTIPIQKQFPLSITTPLQEQAKITIPETIKATLQEQRQQQKQEYKFAQITIPITAFQYRTKTPTIETHVTTVIPTIPEEEKKKLQDKSFNVYSKKDATKQAKWIKLNKEPQSYHSALGLGAKATDETVSRSFKITPTTGEPSNEYSMNWLSLQHKFRQPKSKKLGHYVEKSTYAIDTQGEHEGITVKGWLALRSKRKANNALKQSPTISIKPSTNFKMMYKPKMVKL